MPMRDTLHVLPRSRQVTIARQGKFISHLRLDLRGAAHLSRDGPAYAKS
jgi:hypothetical protein